ncbi:GTPase obg domain protein [Mycobacterium kansasii]|uniref:GTPase obg domain protein n=1 Tax=Mycobacterium kansasii TaxID=1768 RepID=A0A1V3XL91_MYCKA|nr:GTPase obg domain protein [Mycobacterium kansasii]
MRLPVEGHLTDRHRTPRLGTQSQQLVLDTQARQAVREIADGLVVVEVGLPDPAFGPGPVTTKPPRPSGCTSKPLSSTGTGRMTGRRGTT